MGLASAAGVFVHTLEFVDRDHLASAFERIVSSEFVENCLVETERMRIRFLADPTHAETLVERIYLDGGLRFVSRHAGLGQLA